MNKKGELSLIPCIGIIVGGCIGSAIFSLSGQTIKMAGPAAIVSWTIASIILALYGMQVCELAVRYPESGGIFVFPQKAFGGKTGDLWGFVSAWGYIVANIIATAFSAITIGNFMGQGFGLSSDPLFSFLGIEFTWTVVLAVLGTLFCMILNLMKITDAGKFNNILVGLLSIGILVFVGFAFWGKRSDGSPAFTAAYFQNFFTTAKGISGMFSSIPIASVAFGSCVSISFMVGEVKNPNKTIPQSLLIGLIIVLVLYLLMIIATIGTCSDSLFQSVAFLEFAPQFGAIFMDGLVAYPWLAKLIAVLAFIALITTMLVVIALNSRAMQAVSASGFLPKKFSSENKNGIPAFSTVICSAAACLLSLRPDWTNLLVNLGAFFSVISMVITCLALMAARKKTTLSEDQYHCPGGIFPPIITIIALGACYLIGKVSGKVIIFTASVYIVGMIIYFVTSQRRKSA